MPRHPRPTGQMDPSHVAALIQERAKTDEYRRLPTRPTRVRVDISPEMAAYIDSRARELDLSFELAAGFVMAQGIRMAKQARKFASMTNIETLNKKGCMS